MRWPPRRRRSGSSPRTARCSRTTRRPARPTSAPPSAEIVEVGDLRVASTPIRSTAIGIPQLYVQYARDTSGLDKTIGRMWLFLGGGVLAGTALAALAGVAIARRAMRPIAALTAAAGEIASTRDPSRRLPIPPTDDEVAELARTLDQMLAELEAARAETQQMVTGAARVRRRRVARAAHAADQRARKPRAAQRRSPTRAGADPDEAREMVASALRSSRRMSRLVADLLLLARADAGRERRVALVRPGRDRRGCDRRRRSRSPTDARSSCDLARAGAGRGKPGRAAPDGRQPDRQRDSPHARRERGSASASRGDNGSAVLEVTDDGPGLPEGAGDQIFERFVRGSGPADLSADAGIGLGLAIVRAVARSHGGTVAAGTSRGRRRPFQRPVSSPELRGYADGDEQSKHNRHTRNPV